MMKKHDFEKYGEDYLTPSLEKNEDGSIENDTIAVTLNRGDICFYEGTKMNHWRDPFMGNDCVQLFIHYVKMTLPKPI